jgi:hypothetical protein
MKWERIDLGHYASRCNWSVRRARTKSKKSYLAGWDLFDPEGKLQGSAPTATKAMELGGLLKEGE